MTGGELPALLAPDSPSEALAPFQSLLVFGEGPLPANLEAFVERQKEGRWRRLERSP